MSARVRVIIRSRVAWQEMDRSDFSAQDDPTRPLTFIRSPLAEAALDVWDEVFALNFFAYRAALRDIAWTSVAASGADDISVGFDDFDSGGFDAWLNDPTEEIIVALDDD